MTSNEVVVNLEEIPVIEITPENENPENVGIDLTVPVLPVHQARRFYPGDVVIKRTVPKTWEWTPCFGIVMNPLGDNPSSPSYGSTTNFNVHWESSNRVESTQEHQVNLVDRLLLRNTRVTNNDGLVGTVSNVFVNTTVQIIGTNHVVERVTLDRLRPITSFVRGQEILYKDWVGVITCVKRNIWFHLDGGMGFHVPVSENDGFMRNDPYWGVGVACPGIRTRLSSSVMRTAKWNSGPMKFFSRFIPPINYLYSMAHCTINKSEITAIEVKWLTISPSAEDPQAPMPEEVLVRDKLKNVTVIGIPSSETIGINSVRMLKLRAEDSLTSYHLWLEAFQKKFISGDERAIPTRSPASMNAPLRVLATERVYEIPVKVLHRQTFVEVAWNSGNVQKVNSINIATILPTKDDGEFPQGMVVAPLFATVDLDEVYGVVVESDALATANKKKVNVMWVLNGTAWEAQPEPVFNIRPHPKYSLYQRGTIVFPRFQGATKFTSAVVCDLNIASGKMVVAVTTDNSQHEVYPHTVTPLTQRCFWSFFQRKWLQDELVPPSYQLQCEFEPNQRFAKPGEVSPEILSNNNYPGNTLNDTAWYEAAFELLGFAQDAHRYSVTALRSDGFEKGFMSTMENEIAVMKKDKAIPEGICVRCYENRMDLVSALMVGPSGTPFEDGLFMFDLQLTADFPQSPPKVHYVSYSYEINPLMSWDGNFCVSSLDWKFENGKPESYIVDCLAQVQKLVFAEEPYFCNVRKTEERGTEKGRENSRLFNEYAFLRVLDSSWNMIHHPHAPWTALIKSHFAAALPEKLAIYENWNLTEESSENSEVQECSKPTFVLAPVSEGFQMAFKSRLNKFKSIVPNVAVLAVNPEAIEDVTADSESVLVEDTTKPSNKPDIVLELVEPSSTNANEVLENLSPSEVEQIPTVSSAETTEAISVAGSLDSQKNIIKSKSRGSRRNKKRRLLKNLMTGRSSASSDGGSGSEVEGDQEMVPPLDTVVVEDVSETD